MVPPPGARAPPLRAAGRREEESARRRRGIAGSGAGGLRPDFSCDIRGERRRCAAGARTRSAGSRARVGRRTPPGSALRRRRESGCSFGGRISPPVQPLRSSLAYPGKASLRVFTRSGSRAARAEHQGTRGRPQQSGGEVGAEIGGPGWVPEPLLGVSARTEFPSYGAMHAAGASSSSCWSAGALVGVSEVRRWSQPCQSREA